MYTELIKPIAEACHATAVKRGKDTSFIGCTLAATEELAEYWAAIDAQKITVDTDVITACNLIDDEEFMAYYEEHLHNTSGDEMADIVITAATWLGEARLSEGDDYQERRSIYTMFINGVMDFVADQVHGSESAKILFTLIELKRRYNELRKD
jgi:hypothetical protein